MHRRFNSKTYDEINLTPLLDTVFNLLIIFMITAPLLEYSIDVSAPQYNAVELKADDSTKVISISKEKKIQFENKNFSLDELVRRLTDLKQAQKGKNLRIYLRADRELTYGNVIDMLKKIKQAGHGDVSLITEVEE